MADSVEMQDIRALDVDKTLKGFALPEYTFRDAICTIVSTSADQIRWDQETAADLSATAPSVVKNISPLSIFPTLEHTWTRNTSYPQKFACEDFISLEDMKYSDIDVAARTILRLRRAVEKEIDAHVWNIATENQSASLINAVTSTAAWDAASGQNPVEDILEAVYDIELAGYNTSDAVLLLSPKDKRSLMTWLITTVGDKVTSFASDKLQSGNLTGILGLRVLTSVNVTADYAAVVVAKKAVTFYERSPIQARLIEEVGIGTKFRVWADGLAVLTDPKCVSLISNTQT